MQLHQSLPMLNSKCNDNNDTTLLFRRTWQWYRHQSGLEEVARESQKLFARGVLVRDDVAFFEFRRDHALPGTLQVTASVGRKQGILDARLKTLLWAAALGANCCQHLVPACACNLVSSCYREVAETRSPNKCFQACGQTTRSKKKKTLTNLMP